MDMETLIAVLAFMAFASVILYYPGSNKNNGKK